ncbi:MAG: radical SAM superfamily enzyme YgiQ (UPF0313 family) [Bacteriovoracaceae bacterium]|jgi:radical SAM superfamily enzyme YgiQ (UPF0313 family)
MNKEKVIFLNPPSSLGRKLIRNFDCATESKGNYLYQPYDFLLLSASIPENVELLLVDAIADKLSLNDTLIKLDGFSPEILIVSIADSNWKEDFELIKLLRKKYKEKCLIVFGDSFIDPISTEKIKPYVNGILHNPIFVDFNAILKNRSNTWLELKGFLKPDSYTRSDLKKPQKIMIKEPRHIEFLSKNYRWPFSHNFKYTTVFTAWGCPYSCSYCIMAKFPNLFRDYNQVYSELTSIKKLGLKEFYMGDRSFGLPRNNVVSLMEKMISTNLSLKWSTYFHPNQYDPELLELMRNSGCHTIIIGIEIANLKKLKEFGRHTKEGRLETLIDHCNRIGMKICGDFIIGLPGENRKDILDTIKLSQTMKIDYASFNIAAPLAGSSIRELAIEEGRLKEGELEFDSFGFKKVLGNGILSGEELQNLRNLAVRGFYFRVSYLVRSVLRIKTLEQLIIQFQEMIQLFKKSKS